MIAIKPATDYRPRDRKRHRALLIVGDRAIRLTPDELAKLASQADEVLSMLRTRIHLDQADQARKLAKSKPPVNQHGLTKAGRPDMTTLIGRELAAAKLAEFHAGISRRWLDLKNAGIDALFVTDTGQPEPWANCVLDLADVDRVIRRLKKGGGR